MRATAMALTLMVGCAGQGDVKDGVLPPGPTGTETTPGTLPYDTGTDGTVGGTWTSGSQRCVQLTGEADRVRADDDFLPRESDPRTLQVWARTQARADQVIVGYGRPAPALAWIIGTVDGHPYVGNGGSAPLVAEDVYVADGEWHHYAATWDGRVAHLYIDGDEVISGEVEVDTLDGDFVAGNSPTGEHLPFIGILDDVRVFFRARLPQEFPGDIDGDQYAEDWLAMWWDFEQVDGEGFGVEVPDVTGTGIDGTTGGDADSPTFPSCR